MGRPTLRTINGRLAADWIDIEHDDHGAYIAAALGSDTYELRPASESWTDDPKAVERAAREMYSQIPPANPSADPDVSDLMFDLYLQIAQKVLAAAETA